VNIRILSSLACGICAFVVMSYTAIAKEVTPTIKQPTQTICPLNGVEDLLPPPASKSYNSDSTFSYLAQQGFLPSQDGSWVCYVSDPNNQSRYYTLFKVQQVDGTLVASSFLDSGNLIGSQDNRTLDLFMMLVNKHTRTNKEKSQTIRRYLESFISLVKQGKVQPSLHAYFFDQPNQGLVLYHSLKEGQIKGTAIAVNINL
jgi:hypothetical protein